MTDDLIARLRFGSIADEICDDKTMAKAADALEAQARRIAELEEIEDELKKLRDTAWEWCENYSVIIKYEARIAELEAALKDCADDLEAEVDARYRICPDNTVHPAMQRKYERDLLTVRAARAALKKEP